MTPTGLLAAALAADPSRPMVTFYDDATGERVELSVATLDNWVAKTANLFQDGLAAEPGERVAVLLPAHWQTVVVLLGAWSAGLEVALGVTPAGAAVVVACAARLAEATAAGAREVVGLSLRPMGGRLADPPPGVLDFAAEVAGYGDRFVPWTPLSATAPALVLPTGRWTAAELAAEADAAVRRWGLPTGARVLSAAGYDDLPGLLAGLLAPLAAHGSVVLCRNPDPRALADRVAAERVTAVAGVQGGIGGTQQLR